MLTLIMLPIFLAVNNTIKKRSKWLVTGKDVSKEEVERAIKEQKSETEEVTVAAMNSPLPSK